MNERQLAFNILLRFEKTRDRLDVIENRVVDNSKLSGEQIRLIKNLTSGVLRHLYFLDWFSTKLFKGAFDKINRKLKIILRMGFYELIFVDNIPDYATVNEYVKLSKKIISYKTGQTVNAILRSYLRQRSQLFSSAKSALADKPAIKHSFPQWMIKTWQKQWGREFTDKLCSAFNERPEFDVRVNTKVIDVDEFKKILHDLDISYQQSGIFGNYLKINQIGRLKNEQLFEKGYCSVQDESAAIPVKLLNIKKAESFLDMCCAPGGKFTQILEEHSGLELSVGVDSDLSRLLKVKDNLDRLNLKGFLIQADAQHLPFKIKFDRILLDAPCSGQGVINKHPDIKWRRTKQNVVEFTGLQKKLLSSAFQCLQKDGYLVYSTCSVDPSENEDVVNKIVNTEKNIDKVNLQKVVIPELKNYSDNYHIRTFPHKHKMDGSFACLMQKKQ